MAQLSAIKKIIREHGDPQRAKAGARYFKTGKGEYGEGDIFLGLNVPTSRKIARQFADTPLSSITQLLQSKIHEERFIALLILVKKYEQGSNEEKKKIFNLYLKNTKRINNWDLVDTSAPYIIGHYLSSSKQRTSTLKKLAASKNLWERRIAIIATGYFIRQDQFKDTLTLAKLLLHDDHDLIHKAVGWMLREVGKRNKSELTEFLKVNYQQMPRTMLRYAIEKFPPKERQKYLKGKV
jgi:3-methyladenine DNA glycosylase AlkD